MFCLASCIASGPSRACTLCSSCCTCCCAICLYTGTSPPPEFCAICSSSLFRRQKKNSSPLLGREEREGVKRRNRGGPGRMKGKKGAETELKARSALFAGVHTGFRLPQVPAQCDAC